MLTDARGASTTCYRDQIILPKNVDLFDKMLQCGMTRDCLKPDMCAFRLSFLSKLVNEGVVAPLVNLRKLVWVRGDGTLAAFRQSVLIVLPTSEKIQTSVLSVYRSSAHPIR